MSHQNAPCCTASPTLPSEEDDVTLCGCGENCQCDEDCQLCQKHSNSSSFKSTRLSIHGMTCASCVAGVQTTLESHKAISSANINLLTESGVIVHDDSITSQEIKSMVEDMGYEVSILSSFIETKLSIQGMTCSSCSASITKALWAAFPHLNNVNINVVTGSGVISHDPSLVTPQQLVQAIEDMGYEVVLQKSNNQDDPVGRLKSLKSRQQDETKQSMYHFLWSLVFGLPAFIIAMVLMHITVTADWFMQFRFGPGQQVTLDTILLFILATPQQFWIGWSIHKGAYHSLRYAKSANMDVLISLGTWVAYLYSTIAMILLLVLPLTPHEGMTFMPFFETSVLLITFVLLGRWLDHAGKGKAVDSLVGLVKLHPDTATRVKMTSLDEKLDLRELETETIQAQDIAPGDQLLILPGSRFPCDGSVLLGTSYVDESALTGEPVPVLKSKGDQVVGGTLISPSASATWLIMRADKVGADTVLASIVRLVETSQEKSPVTLVVDKISNVFVPIILVLSLLTFTIWSLVLTFAPPAVYLEDMNHQHPLVVALNFAVTVLVIACPCALGLATPLASLVGTGLAAQNGILVRGGSTTMESTKDIDIVLLDKTGTITEGEMTVEELVVVAHEKVEKVWEMASTVEMLSQHPIARAIVNAKPFEAWKVESSEEFPGKGIKATLSKDSTHQVLVGSDVWFKSLNIELASLDMSVPVTWIHVATDNVHVGSFKVHDPIRPDSQKAVEYLQKLGKQVWMVTGDGPAVAQHVASQVGIPSHRVISRADPTRKREVVVNLQEEHKVAFLGDGINDAAAITQADLGLAVGNATDIALDSAQVVLLRSTLSSLCTFFDLSRKTYHRILLNLVWAFVFNVVMIPLAAGILYVPANGWMLPAAYAGLAMALSSVMVVASSLLLRLYRPKSF